MRVPPLTTLACACFLLLSAAPLWSQPARSLRFLDQPTDTEVGQEMPAIRVEALNAAERRADDFDDDIRLEIGNNPGGGTLEGDAVEQADDGVAEFEGLSIDRTGSGYTLVASADGLTSATSEPFDITAGPASGDLSTIDADPTSIPADSASTSTITVRLHDKDGNELTDGGDVVMLATTAGSLGPVTDNGDGTYTSILQASSTPGEATITGEVNDDDIEDTATVAFTEPPPQPTALAFLVQPSDASAGATITPPVAVHAVDGSGNTDTSFGGEITVAIGTNPGGGTLDGTTTRTAVAGVATFDDLSIAQAGSGYTLTASASGLTSATSTAFDIAPGPASGETSTITADPTAIPADGASTSAITVDLKDGFGNERTSGGDIVTLATTAGSLGPVTDNGDGSYGAVLTAPTTAGTATITGTVNGAAIADTASVQFAQQSAAQAVALAFLVQPSDAPAGATIVPPVVVRALDGSGNTDASFGGQITVAIGTNPGGGTLDGTTTRTAVAGVATFDDLSIARTGAGYTLVASGGGLTNATSAAFDITPGPASGGNSTITADPVSIPADGASTSAITVELKDAFDNDLVAGGDTVTLATTAGSLGPVTDRGNGTYTATLTASSAAGTATITGRVNGQTISGTATVTFARGSADLAITVAANDPTPVEGGTVVYTVTVTNNGPDVATGVEVTDELADLASRVTFVSATATRGTYDSGAGLWSLGTLPSGESAILIVTVRVNRDAGGP